MTTLNPSEPQSRTDRSALRRALPLGIAILALACFARSLTAEFVSFDDFHLLEQNTAFRGLGWANLRWMFTTFHLGPYQPLSWITYAIDYLIWGMRPFGFHLTNVLLHSATAVAFYFLSARLLRLAVGPQPAPDDLRIAAAVAALFFAIHPLRVESVAWATERRDVLSGLLYMMTVLLYLQYVAAAGPSRRRAFLVALGLFVLCLLAKAMAMTLPVALLVLDVYPLRRLGGEAGWIGPRVRTVWLEKIPFLVAALAAALAAVFGQEQSGALATLERTGALERIGIAGYAVWFYLIKTVAPFGLAVIYEIHRPLGRLAVRMAAGVLATIVVTALLIRRRERAPALLAAWLFYLVTLAPVSGLLHAGWQIAADRYSYLPMLGFAVLAGGGVLRLLGAYRTGRCKPASAAVFGTVVVVVLVGFGFGTVRQTAHWRDSRALWRRALTVDPRCTIARRNLAVWEHLAGNNLAALPLALQSAAERPNDPKAVVLCGHVLNAVGREDEAAEYMRRAAELPDTTPEALAEYGLVIARRGDLVRARLLLEQGVRGMPEHGQAQATLGLCYLGAGDIEGMRRCFAAAAEGVDLNADTFRVMATAWTRLGQPQEAVAVLRKGVDALDDDGLRRELAWRLATSMQEAARNGAEALRLAEDLVKRGGADDPARLTVLAAAQAEVGRFAAARETLDRATHAAQARGDNATADRCREWLTIIDAGRPIRE